MVEINHPKIDIGKSYWISSLGDVHYKEAKPFISVVIYELKPGVKLQGFFPSHKMLFYKPLMVHLEIDFITIVASGKFIVKGKIIENDFKISTIDIHNLGIEKSEKNLPFYKIRPIKDFLIKKKTISTNGVNKEISEMNFAFSKHWSLPCLWYKNDRKITVFPCIEIIRTHFCTSSQLTVSVFNGDLLRGNIYNPNFKRTTKYRDANLDGSDQITLRKHIPNSDKVTVAMIALLEEWYRTAKRVFVSIEYDRKHKYSQKKHDTTESIAGYPETFFPYNDKATLKVKSINMGVCEVGEFSGYSLSLVTEILGCDKVFLENGFHFRRDNDSSKKDDDSQVDITNSQRLLKEEKVSEAAIQVNQEISGNKKGKRLLVSSSLLFSEDFIEGNIEYVKGDEQKYTSEGGFVKQEEPLDYSFQDVSSVESLAGRVKSDLYNDDTSENTKSREFYVSFYETLIQKFEKHPDYKIERLGKSGHLTFDPHLPNLNPKSKDFARGEKEKNKKGPWWGKRIAFATTIRFNEKDSITILDVMKRKGSGDSQSGIFVLFNSELTMITETTLKELFIHFSEKRKISLSDYEFMDLERRVFKHNENTFSNIERFINERFRRVESPINKI